MFAEGADAMLANNVYGVAFGTARRVQLGIDPKVLNKQIQDVTDADVQRLAETTFAATRRITVIIDVE